MDKTLLFVTPGDIVTAPLVSAIENEFPWVTVEQVPGLIEACSSFSSLVSLILVDPVFIEILESHAAQLHSFHPSALVAVMQDDSRQPIDGKSVFGRTIIRGVLPMNLKLDVWLSVVRLMLRGGEYFPPYMFQSLMARKELAKPAVPRSSQARSEQREELHEALDELTERELEILRMVSQGLQNKLIAAALRLSENTVKIHIHNLITKLGAHNRTEAAAIFHESGGKS